MVKHSLANIINQCKTIFQVVQFKFNQDPLNHNVASSGMQCTMVKHYLANVDNQCADNFQIAGFGFNQKPLNHNVASREMQCNGEPFIGKYYQSV